MAGFLGSGSPLASGVSFLFLCFQFHRCALAAATTNATTVEFDRLSLLSLFFSSPVPLCTIAPPLPSNGISRSYFGTSSIVGGKISERLDETMGTEFQGGGAGLDGRKKS